MLDSAVSRNAQKNIYSVFFGCFMFFGTANAHIGNIQKLSPAITLLGDYHLQEQRILEGQHLKYLLSVLAQKNSPYTVLVEDNYYSTERSVKNKIPERMKIGLMRGFIQRLNHYCNRNINAITLERGNLIASAWHSFMMGEDLPPFYGMPPKELALQKLPHPYKFTFNDVLTEVDETTAELANRHEFTHQQNVDEFRKTMIERIGKLKNLLCFILKKHGIDLNENVLTTAIDLWLYKCLFKNPHAKNKIDHLQNCLRQFKFEYSEKMDQETWRENSKVVYDAYDAIFRSYAPIAKPIEPHSFFKNFTIYLSKMLCCTMPAAPPQEDHPIAEPSEPMDMPNMSPERAEAFDELGTCLFNLRLAPFDCRAVLDVIAHEQTSSVVVIAGETHTQNIAKYLVRLGHTHLGPSRQGQGFLQHSELDI